MIRISSTLMELFKNILCRNNTMFPKAQKTAVDNRNLKAAMNLGNTFRKNAILTGTLLLLLCLGQLLTTTSAASVHERDVTSTTKSVSSGTKQCLQNTPCGWAIYIPFTRRVDDFIKNICECPSSFACMRNDDNLSMHSYVYRCRSRELSTNT